MKSMPEQLKFYAEQAAEVGDITPQHIAISKNSANSIRAPTPGHARKRDEVDHAPSMNPSQQRYNQSMWRL